MKITVNATTKYDIIIERDVLKDAAKYLELDRKCIIITDDNIPKTYINTIKSQIKEAYVYTILHGEASKNIDNLEKILAYMLDNNFTRTDCVIALGGGVVGDLSGLVASLYMRGIDFYNIPTTLLSQVDSSIGGKTAIDFMNVKNVVGTFYQPKCVLIDPNTLKTLDKRQFSAGLVEAIKMAACFDEDLFSFIEESNDINKDIDEIIYKSLLIKKNVVEKDEKESNIRKSLNFGHTIGHAIEAKFAGKYLHGECVGMGMLYFSSEDVKSRIKSLLEKYNLPTKVEIQADELINYIKHDKKASSNMITIIYVDKIGTYKEIKEDILTLNKYF